MAKDFKKQAARPSVYETLNGYTQEEQAVLLAPNAPNAQEVQERQENMTTRGCKGAKMHRINMAFSTSNYDFIRTMSKIKGQTMTQYVNEVLERERQQAGEVFDKARELIKDL